tara:strand:- start:802 stop:1038 length:237 start_codon:yes stop_codon:yes gene_type:complete
MPIEAWIHGVAAGMLGIKDLPLDLRNYLDEIEMYANLAGGSIQSRQVVSLALINYYDRQHLLKKIKRLEKILNDKKEI